MGSSHRPFDRNKNYAVKKRCVVMMRTAYLIFGAAEKRKRHFQNCDAAETVAAHNDNDDGVVMVLSNGTQ